MTVVKEDVLQIILVRKERVTVSQTVIVSSQAGQSVAMTCVSTISTSHWPNIPTTQLGLGSPALTTAATGCATKITTDVLLVL